MHHIEVATQPSGVAGFTPSLPACAACRTACRRAAAATLSRCPSPSGWCWRRGRAAVAFTG